MALPDNDSSSTASAPPQSIIPARTHVQAAASQPIIHGVYPYQVGAAGYPGSFWAHAYQRPDSSNRLHNPYSAYYGNSYPMYPAGYYGPTSQYRWPGPYLNATSSLQNAEARPHKVENAPSGEVNGAVPRPSAGPVALAGQSTSQDVAMASLDN